MYLSFSEISSKISTLLSLLTAIVKLGSNFQISLISNDDLIVRVTPSKLRQTAHKMGWLEGFNQIPLVENALYRPY